LVCSARACGIEDGVGSFQKLSQATFFWLIMTAGSFQALLQRFFTQLRTEYAGSPHTISAYRDTFRLLLRFMAKHCSTSIDQISWEAFSPDTILVFLQHLEEERLNTARTRNARLAAIRAFVRFVLGNVSPDFAGDAQRILAIPCKRSVRPVLGFLSLNEVEFLLAAIDVSTWTGRRDYLLFSLLYNTGARISEVLQLTPADIHQRILRLHGKGRKERDIPLWPQTHRLIQKWCRENEISSDQPIFGNRAGKPLSRRSAARRFALALRKAQKGCPALRRPDLSPHSIRHYLPFLTMSGTGTQPSIFGQLHEAAHDIVLTPSVNPMQGKGVHREVYDRLPSSSFASAGRPSRVSYRAVCEVTE
jgi:site-specific recombinase XerD